MTEQDNDSKIAVQVALRFGEGQVAEVRAMAMAMSYRSSIVIGVTTNEAALGFDVLGTNIPRERDSLAGVLEVLALALRKGQVTDLEDEDEQEYEIDDEDDDRPPARRVDDVVDNVP
jgi:hypothetical protein